MYLKPTQTTKTQLFLNFSTVVTIFSADAIQVPRVLEEWAINNLNGVMKAEAILTQLSVYMLGAEEKHRYEYGIKELAVQLYNARLHIPDMTYELTGETSEAV